MGHSLLNGRPCSRLWTSDRSCRRTTVFLFFLFSFSLEKNPFSLAGAFLRKAHLVRRNSFFLLRFLFFFDQSFERYPCRLLIRLKKCRCFSDYSTTVALDNLTCELKARTIYPPLSLHCPYCLATLSLGSAIAAATQKK